MKKYLITEKVVEIAKNKAYFEPNWMKKRRKKKETAIRYAQLKASKSATIYSSVESFMSQTPKK